MHFEIGLITGLMFGAEYIELDETNWIAIVDVGILRFILSTEPI